MWYLIVSIPDLCTLTYFDYKIVVEEPGFKNVKNKHLGMPPFWQNFHLFYPLVHSIDSMKPDIATNLSLANIPVTVCLIRYPSFS